MPSYQETLARYLTAEQAVAIQTGDYFSRAYSILDVPTVKPINDTLVLANRTDLVMTKRADMKVIDGPPDINAPGINFAQKFRIVTGWRETGVDDILGDERVREVIPVTAADLWDLRKLPAITSNEQLAELRQSGRFPALAEDNHASRPAFSRMLTICPEFTMDLVLEMSRPDQRYRYAHFEARTFAAYCLMALMVDVKDPGVRQEDCLVNPRYLLSS